MLRNEFDMDIRLSLVEALTVSLSREHFTKY
jgi:hypothetical protein